MGEKIGCVQHDCDECRRRKREEWVSVNDRLPKDDPRRRWMVCYQNPKHYAPKDYHNPARRTDRVAIPAIYSGGAWRFIDVRDKTRLSERVTHWRPWPKLPPKARKPLSAGTDFTTKEA